MAKAVDLLHHLHLRQRLFPPPRLLLRFRTRAPSLLILQLVQNFLYRLDRVQQGGCGLSDVQIRDYLFLVEVGTGVLLLLVLLEVFLHEIFPMWELRIQLLKLFPFVYVLN